ncbi:hypothetical protein E2C01_063572 [Portunus trituberculatus]|uniref:Uncharacterized protein n=1 Tax=Portunus trituberculatus TaxID=210409 RepID=A0A5B7HHZ3_PORTR|nr:hypothetical protein [Portunus trituberculatus]
MDGDVEWGGRRKRGRSRTRWKDCIVADGRENLDLEVAGDRDSSNSNKNSGTVLGREHPMIARLSPGEGTKRFLVLAATRLRRDEAIKKSLR